MIRKLTVLFILAFALTGIAQAASQDITFDGSGSGFFQRNNWETLPIDSNDPDYEYSGYKSMADALSVEWVAVNSYLYSDAFFSTSDPSATFSGEIFDLNALWLASGFGSQTLVLKGFDANGDVLYSANIAITTQAQLYQFDWTGISAFNINTFFFNDFVRNPLVQYSESPAWVLGIVNVASAAEEVPEPGTYAMLLSGLGIVGAFARRRRTGA